jgi:hypothetical protein
MMAFADLRDYERIETRVFAQADRSLAVSDVNSLITGGASQLQRFQDALAYYRIAEITTNKDMNEKSISILEGLCRETTNVYVFSYLGVAYASRSRFLGTVGGLSAAKKAKSCFDFAVSISPGHYLPRFYRGMYNLFVPAIFGGDEQQGVRDMQIVLNQMDSIRREDDYKAFIYLINGIYWGDKKKDYVKALVLLNRSKLMADDEQLLKAINDKITEYTSRL